MTCTTSIQIPQGKASFLFFLSLKCVEPVTRLSCGCTRQSVKWIVVTKHGHQCWATRHPQQELFPTWKSWKKPEKFCSNGLHFTNWLKVGISTIWCFQACWATCTPVLLASQIAYKIQVTIRSHVLFSLTADLLSPSRKRWWVCWFFFPEYTAGTLKRDHHLILKDSE